MKRVLAVIAFILVIGAAVWFGADRLFPTTPPGPLYGNVEIRQVDLAFNSEGTVIAMHKRAGDPVHAVKSSRSWMPRRIKARLISRPRDAMRQRPR